MSINSLNDLRPGDLMFGPIGGIVPGWLPVGIGQAILGEGFTVGPVRIRHVGVVVEAGRLVQAMPGGAEEIELTAKHWTPEYAYVRPPYAGLRAPRTAAVARMFVAKRVPYSFLSYAALAAWRWGMSTPKLEAWINRRDKDGYPREAICSVLADQAMTMAGFQVMTGVKRQCVTPGALAARFWFHCPGAVWGGAAWAESGTR